MPAKLSAELLSKGGHDIREPRDALTPGSLPPGLVDVSDIAKRPREQARRLVCVRQGGTRYVKGQWLGIPYLYLSFSPGSHRIDFFEQVGEKAPDNLGRSAASGPGSSRSWATRVGFAHQSGPRTPFHPRLSSILWCFGAKEVAADGPHGSRSRSKETEAALDYGPGALYTEGHGDPVGAPPGTNASNNQFLNSGAGLVDPQFRSVTYRRGEGKEDAGRRADRLSPRRPAGPGRPPHTVGVPRKPWAIWKASKNIDAAREFLRWFLRAGAKYHEWIMSGDNYKPSGSGRDMESHAVWSLDPKYKGRSRRSRSTRISMAGRPARPERAHPR